jgi:hypothetical protein
MEYLSDARLYLVQAARRLFRATAPDYATNGVSRTKLELWDRIGFAAKLKNVEEAPEPLRGVMAAALRPHDRMRWLIFGPTQRTVGAASPASLFAILEREWLVVVCGEDVEPRVYRCEFHGHFTGGDNRCPALRQVETEFCERLPGTIDCDSIQHSYLRALSRSRLDFAEWHGRLLPICRRRKQEHIRRSEDLVAQISKRDPGGATNRRVAPSTVTSSLIVLCRG